MTAPNQRGGANGPAPNDQAFALVVDSLRTLHESVSSGFRDVNTQLGRLPDTYVPRREFDRYRDERSLDFQQALLRHDTEIHELCADHDRDVAALRKDIADNEAKRVASRRFVLTTLVALGGFLIALAALVLAHVHF